MCSVCIDVQKQTKTASGELKASTASARGVQTSENDLCKKVCGLKAKGAYSKVHVVECLW